MASDTPALSHNTVVFLTGLPPSTTESSLRSSLCSYGQVLHVKMNHVGSVFNGSAAVRFRAVPSGLRSGTLTLFQDRVVRVRVLPHRDVKAAQQAAQRASALAALTTTPAKSPSSVEQTQQPQAWCATGRTAAVPQHDTPVAAQSRTVEAEAAASDVAASPAQQSGDGRLLNETQAAILQTVSDSLPPLPESFCEFSSGESVDIDVDPPAVE